MFEKNSYLKVWRAHFVILFGSQQPENFPPNIGFSTLTPKLSHEWLVAVLSYNIISTFTLNLIVKWLERRFASDIFPILKVSCWQDKSKLKSFSQKPLLGKLKCVVSLPSHVLLIFLQNNQLVLLLVKGRSRLRFGFGRRRRYWQFKNFLRHGAGFFLSTFAFGSVFSPNFWRISGRSWGFLKTAYNVQKPVSYSSILYKWSAKNINVGAG